MNSQRSIILGLGLVLLITLVSLGLALFLPAAVSPLLIAILLGLVIGNLFYPALEPNIGSGVNIAKKQVLRLAIVLYGFRLTFADIASVGMGALLIDIIMVFTTFFLTLWLARKWFDIDRQTAILMGAGASICGAAAVLATDAIVKAPAHKVSVAVATVVLFGTLAILVYPIIYSLGIWPFTEAEFGIYIGSSVHEVAQVVAAGGIINQLTADTAVITKMTRVLLLAPFLFMLSGMINKQADNNMKQKIGIPLFAIGFVVVVALHSLPIWPNKLIDFVVSLDTILLCMAMAALGLTTHFAELKKVGLAPFKLGSVLFVWLVVGGGFIAWLVFLLSKVIQGS